MLKFSEVVVLNEMPELINPDSVNGKDSQKVWESYRDHGWVVEKEIKISNVSKFSNYKFYSDTTEDQYFLVRNADSRCVYRVKFSRGMVVRLKDNIKATRQVYIWKDSNHFPEEFESSSIIVRAIFWDILLPMHGCMVCDTEQTPDGKNLWKKFISVGLKRRMRIFHLNT